MTTQEKILLGLLIFVPLALLNFIVKMPPMVSFILSGLAIVPLAAWIANSTEAIAEVIGPALGGLLNATFGNVTEMIIAIVALRQGLAEVVKASLSGAIIANLLLGLGLAIVVGGIRFPEQQFSAPVARINASALTLSVIVLMTPTAIQAVAPSVQLHLIDRFSYASAILLLIFYGLMLLFSMKTHRHLYLLDETIAGQEPSPAVNLKVAVAILLVGTILLVFVSDILVDSLQDSISEMGLTQLFIGVFLIPVFSSVVEFITCIKFALNNCMEGAVAVAIGSSLQIILFVTPVLVLVGWFLGQPQMNLSFNVFELLAVMAAVAITNSISNDGRTNWLEGVLLMITYLVLAIAFFIHP
ncbi:calcium/proton exchanger [Thermosynechococcus sp. HN-54]|uniref:calcium/proton exchanger n=1 Tax=Thermosynechococcus sp. HN-54 TaxID=2933959 RepID=UPI00202D0286|nr:calcium/proton exchanger [Thermosynechococcus sp. HN-54]URR35601.1 calcium/proton exchanger [Thermosynechococcus sp. HN-54]